MNGTDNLHNPTDEGTPYSNIFDPPDPSPNGTINGDTISDNGDYSSIANVTPPDFEAPSTDRDPEEPHTVTISLEELFDIISTSTQAPAQEVATISYRDEINRLEEQLIALNTTVTLIFITIVCTWLISKVQSIYRKVEQ
ncbi:MAG: DUF2240 family protein [Lachnospiraceae bacterium]|jgi:phosphoglycerate-specific signal transduction histidine kinase|nr:DUF2240 family protein [Lachnospiraceae bacterium]